MEFAEVLRRRRMVRAFRPDPIPHAVLDLVLDAARRAPAAGNSDGTDLVVLEGPQQTARYWDITLPAGSAREQFGYPRLLDAPVLVLPLTNERAYLERYAEPDKEWTGLGESADRWPVPYWTVDTSFAAMLVLLAATAQGLGSLFFGIFDHEPELLRALAVPHGRRAIGTIAIGWPDLEADAARPGRSANRARRSTDEIVHRGHW
ncbi:MAG TPA: nitroreductase family protein [Acidimicrobiales bacterium]|nr:nitroreductase family protein [Acidimicrobiales bacterium]